MRAGDHLGRSGGASNEAFGLVRRGHRRKPQASVRALWGSGGSSGLQRFKIEGWSGLLRLLRVFEGVAGSCVV